MGDEKRVSGVCMRVLNGYGWKQIRRASVRIAPWISTNYYPIEQADDEKTNEAALFQGGRRDGGYE